MVLHQQNDFFNLLILSLDCTFAHDDTTISPVIGDMIFHKWTRKWHCSQEFHEWSLVLFCNLKVCGGTSLFLSPYLIFIFSNHFVFIFLLITIDFVLPIRYMMSSLILLYFCILPKNEGKILEVRCCTH